MISLIVRFDYDIVTFGVNTHVLGFNQRVLIFVSLCLNMKRTEDNNP
jgi:hypothetical protein